MYQVTRVELISEDLTACRICLATNTRLYSIPDSLEDKFVELMGVEYSDDDGLPQHLCPYCRMQLLKFADLRVRCHRSQELLRQALKQHPYLSTDNILSIDRNFHKLALNLVELSVYTFNLHNKKITQIDVTEDLNMQVSDDDAFDGREELTEANTETVDPLIEEAVNTLIIPNEVIVTEAPTEQPQHSQNQGLFVEIDGLNGKIKIKNAEAVKEKDRMLKQYKKRLAEKEERKSKEKKQRISNLIRFVAGKKRNAKPLTKWQMQLRRAENDYLPNFDHAMFERDHECTLDILTTEEQLAEIEERKQSSNYLNLDYKCQMCGRGFEFEQPYKNHMAKHDRRVGKFQCEICQVYYRTQYLKYRHLDCHKMKFTCNLCAFVTRTKHMALAHYRMHAGKRYTCKHCGATFTKSTSYLGHVRINHPSADAVCDVCGDAFVGARGLRYHKAKAHKVPKVKFSCKTCGVKFLSLDAKNRHKNERGDCDARMSACAECGDVFDGEQPLRAHADASHGPGSYYCEECKQTFVSQESYDIHHQRIHLKLKWPAYGRTREMNKEYYKKIKERTRLKAQVVCEICGAKLMSNAALERHQQSQCRRERSARSYKCPHCDKTCATRQGLQLHVTLHTGEKPYKCSQCPLEFRQSGALKRHHKAVHLGIDTRVQCEYCAKYFSTPSTRKLHVNTVHLKLPQPVRRRRKGADH